MMTSLPLLSTFRFNILARRRKCVEEAITAKIHHWASDCRDVLEIKTISTEGQSEVYLIGNSGQDPDAFYQSVEGCLSAHLHFLPTGSSLPLITLLADDELIEEIEIQQIETQRLVIDSAFAARNGYTMSALLHACQDLLAEGVPLQSETPITIGEQTFPLGAVVEIIQEQKPSHIVATYPSE